MKGGDCVSQIRGYLLKRNKEHRKANLLGAKYKRRWVELTANTLVYAKSQQELLSGGKVEVFPLHKLLWVKCNEDLKFQVKFPERTLVFKVEAGGSNERDKWVAALEQAKRVEKEAQQQCGTEKLVQLKKEAAEWLLDPHSSDGSCSSIPAHRAALPAAGRGILAESADGYSGTSSWAGSAALGPVSAGLAIPPTSSRTTETGGQTLSPRSLLASAKAGSAFVSSTSAAGGDSVYKSAAPGKSAAQQCDVTADASNEEEETEAPAGLLAKSPGPIRAGSLERACNRLEAADSAGRAGSSSSNLGSPSTAGHTAVLQEVECSAGSGSASPRRRQERRASLQRRLTPGVMLINTAPLLTPEATSPAPQTAPTLKLSAGDSACNTPRAPGVTPPGKQLQQQSHLPAAQTEDELCDEILRLDPNDVGLHCSYISQTTAAQAALPPGIRGSMEASNRPGSAPQYRPGTPLKSCLRGSSNDKTGCSSSASNSQQLLSCSGSHSMPASSAEAAAAAAAAVASLLLHRGTGSASSPLSKRAVGTQQHPGDIPAGGSTAGDKDWVQNDWDGSGDESDHDEQPRIERANPAGHHTAPRNSVEGRFGPVAKGSKAPHQNVAGSLLAVAKGSSMVKGVAADSNWLDDNFDD